MFVYLIGSIIFFSMLYALIYGFYELVKTAFWGYHDRIMERIERFEADAKIYGNEEMLVGALKRQEKELEDIMGQYVFFRFCERLSAYLIQSDMAILFCASLATVIFAHSAVLNHAYLLLGIWMAVYIAYAWVEMSGQYTKFEVWAANIFMKQYRSLSSSGTSSIVEVKKGNKKLIRKLYLFFTVPVALAAVCLLFRNISYPLLPEMNGDLELAILKLWGLFIFWGLFFIAVIPSFLDRVLKAQLKFTPGQLKGTLFAAPIYLFLSLIMAIIISIAKYNI